MTSLRFMRSFNYGSKTGRNLILTKENTCCVVSERIRVAKLLGLILLLSQFNKKDDRPLLKIRTEAVKEIPQVLR